MMVVHGHAFGFKTSNPILNIDEVPDFMGTYWVASNNLAFFNVDVFFWLSGFLKGLFVLWLLEDKGGKMGIKWVWLFVHRYIRLMPVYAFFIFFYWAVVPHMSDNPLWDNTG